MFFMWSRLKSYDPISQKPHVRELHTAFRDPFYGTSSAVGAAEVLAQVEAKLSPQIKKSPGLERRLTMLKGEIMMRQQQMDKLKRQIDQSLKTHLQCHLQILRWIVLLLILGLGKDGL